LQLDSRDRRWDCVERVCVGDLVGVIGGDVWFVVRSRNRGFLGDVRGHYGKLGWSVGSVEVDK
jgi:hypothetical protein